MIANNGHHYRTLFDFSNELHELTRILILFRVNSR